MGLTKGIRFTNLRAFLTARSGAGAWERLLATRTPADAAMLGGVVASGWYDHALRARLVRAICAGSGGAALGREIGRFEADRDLSTVQRWFLYLVKPAFAFRNMNGYWRRTEDEGRWTSEVSGCRIVARLHDWNPVEPALCATVQGYLSRTLELLTGRAHPLDHARCRAGGDPFCEFRVDDLSAQELTPARSSGSVITLADLAGIAQELAGLPDVEAVADAAVALLHGRLGFPHVALRVRVDEGGDPRLIRAAGARGGGAPCCFVLQTGGSTVGRLDVEAPPGPVDPEVLDQLLSHLAVALLTAGARLDPVPPSAGERAPASDEERRVHEAAERWRLTPREREVLVLVIQGRTNKEIAGRLGCQEGTVEVHVSKALRKSGAGNRAGLAARVWSPG
jgi:RNA polymerase sigma factor (sigma-70 family)